MYPKRRGLCGILILTASLTVVGCGSSGNSNVRAVNASAGFAPFTYQVGQIGIAAALPYGTEGVEPQGDYAAGDTSGNYRFVGAGTNQTLSTYATPGTALVSLKQTLVKNTFYTIVSYGASPTMGLIALTDDDSAPPSGEAKMRFVNYSGNSAVDVYVTAVGGVPSGNPTIGNLGFNNPTYVAQAPGTLELLITPAGSLNVIAAQPFSPAAGKIYSVFFMNPAPNTSTYITLIVNDPVSAATTTTSSGS